MRQAEVEIASVRSPVFCPRVLRIISDLHLFDANTQVKDLRQLEPLLADVTQLVINGDSCELRHGIGTENAARFKAFMAERVPEIVYITGNHDPEISDTHELLLAGGRVWVTHGDVCFDDLTPWSRRQPELWALVQEELKNNSAADYRELAMRFHVARQAARLVRDDVSRMDKRLTARIAWLWHTFFPPRQIIAMLRAWRDLPKLAAKLAIAQRPTAQVVITGHVHFPGVWPMPGGVTVINTGSFLAPLGGHLVDLEGETLHVRRIKLRDGQFHPGREIAKIPLGK